ncbi:MAG: winged helix-turn-helix transcriptional regulator, partial [Candidatus Micrarchaeales archaeon]
MAKTGPACPTLSLLHILGKRWTVPILEMFGSKNDKMQFNSMQLLLGDITPKNLSNSLKDLCTAEILEKKEVKEGKILHTEYVLTKKGAALKQFIRNAKELGVCIYGLDSSCIERQCSTCSLFK